jgi:hypothetical protein
MTEQIIRHGSKRKNEITFGQCIINALHNIKLIQEKHLHKVMDGQLSNVNLCIGSMGFALSQDDDIIHWEYGNPKWKTLSDWEKHGLKAGGFDIHVWVSYMDTEGNEIIIDPWFEQYDIICDLWGSLRATPVARENWPASRRYYQLMDRKLHEAMRLSMITMAHMKRIVPPKLRRWLNQAGPTFYDDGGILDPRLRSEEE